MSTTIRLLSTYNGFKPQSIITVDDAIATQLIAGLNATTDLTGGASAFQPGPNSGVSTGTSLPANQTVVAGQSVLLVLPANANLALNGTSDIAGTREILNPDGTVASTQALQAGTSVVGVFLVDTRIRFNVAFGTLTTRAGVVAGTIDAAPLYTSSATLSNIEDKRGFGKTIEAANTPVLVRRTPTTTVGTFLNTGDVNLTYSGAAGEAGDYLRSLSVQVEAGGDASVFLTQRNDAIFHDSTTVGAAIAASATQTLTSGPALVATAGQLADRVASLFYQPTGGVAQWVTREILGNAAPSGSTISVTFKEALPAGAAPTRWIIHGPRAQRVMESGRAARAEPYAIDVREASQTGGWVAWVGNAISRMSAYRA